MSLDFFAFLVFDVFDFCDCVVVFVVYDLMMLSVFPCSFLSLCLCLQAFWVSLCLVHSSLEYYFKVLALVFYFLFIFTCILSLYLYSRALPLVFISAPLPWCALLAVLHLFPCTFSNKYLPIKHILTCDYFNFSWLLMIVGEMLKQQSLPALTVFVSVRLLFLSVCLWVLTFCLWSPVMYCTFVLISNVC